VGASTTVVFADLAGSTALFEAIGNVRATEAITGLTHWIGSVCAGRGGRVVKLLGDGVLAVFPDGNRAITAVVELQRVHARRLEGGPEEMRMRLQIGVAAGEVIEVDGDCYGDAVNVASRLSDLSGPDQIWATASAVRQVPDPEEGVGFRSLGPILLRGMSRETMVFRVDWQEDLPGMQTLTEAGRLPHRAQPRATSGGVRLSWLDQQMEFAASRMPVHLGRAEDAQFPVQDQRVSRLHARIHCRNGSFVLTDLSSYGTWVRFAGSPTALTLRRAECILLGAGSIALGAPFEDFAAPTVGFEIVPGSE
jgi:class 3 adenylate cyclase